MVISDLMPTTANVDFSYSSPNLTMEAVSTAVLSQNLDTFQESGDAMVKMMEQSVTPYLGANIDVQI